MLLRKKWERLALTASIWGRTCARENLCDITGEDSRPGQDATSTTSTYVCKPLWLQYQFLLPPDQWLICQVPRLQILSPSSQYLGMSRWFSVELLVKWSTGEGIYSNVPIKGVTILFRASMPPVCLPALECIALKILLLQSPSANWTCRGHPVI